jgi:asparagine synthase (glutamine-hydrolysing)
MCGIAGLIRTSAAAWEPDHVLDAMTSAVRHRGPDDAGAWHDRDHGVSLGHRRLSILDLSSEGHQPMLDQGQRYVITYNGEVYNFAELRDELRAGGAAFRSASDTEVILAGVARWGVEATVRRLNGIFAFALYDRTRQRLYLVRDHLGVKPLYYGVIGGCFAFASELSPFRRLPNFSDEIDLASVDALLRYGYVPTPRSIFRDVRKLTPGTIAEIDVRAPTAEPALSRYWSASQVAEAGAAGPFTGTPDDAVEALDELLRRAVGAQMVSDVPLGAFLSGGIDSSTIVALMQAQSSRPVRTFSIGFQERGYDEAAAAARVAAHLGTSHTDLYVSSADALAVIPQLPTLYDEPFADSSQLPTYLVSRLARRDVTVALSGDGGDELFAGYNRHVLGERLWRRMSLTPMSLRRAARRAIAGVSPARYESVIGGLQRLTGRPVTAARTGFKLHKLAALLDADTQADFYERLTSQWTGVENAVRQPNGAAAAARRIPAAGLPSFTEQMMHWDLVSYLPDDILVKVDRASMACSLEARVPFLDPRVVEFAWRLPLSLKQRMGQGKWVLRQVLDRYVPRALVDRPKAGFAVPIDSWLRGPLREWAEELLSREALERHGIFDARVVRSLWQRHLSGSIDAQHALWNVLMFQAWDGHHRRL